MAVVRSLVEQRYSAGRGRVVEPELDMARTRAVATPAISKVQRLLRWLMPNDRGARPPMRSVDRELEETFPSFGR